MFKLILVPTDGSALSEKAGELAVEFARSHGASLIALSVAEAFPFSPFYESASAEEAAAYESQLLARAFSHVQKIAQAASRAGVTCETCVVQSFSPHAEIVKAAGHYRCDAIFMASHGRKGLTRFFLGSETQKVLAHSTIPVLVVR
jgi:nucleotide-binding universal stress UspA family protein